MSDESELRHVYFVAFEEYLNTNVVCELIAKNSANGEIVIYLERDSLGALSRAIQGINMEAEENKFDPSSPRYSANMLSATVAYFQKVS